MEDDYKDDDRVDNEKQGTQAVIDYFAKNVLKQAARGFLFGLGHYITYKLIGGYISKKYPKFN